VSSSPDRLRRDGGFTLVEVLICTLILSIGTLAIAGLLGVTTHMHMGAREATRATRLAQEKLDELMKQNFSVNPSIAIGGNLDANVANYFETPIQGVTTRWAVQAGPAADTRVVTVRVINVRARQFGRQVELTTIVRQW
jgi:prepilin-type N-terminal cleavage/methylation domain-containing protein